MNDAARLISKLVRGADFACRDRDGSILVTFADTAPRQAQTVAKRLVSVLRNTMLQAGRRRPVAPDIALTAWRSTDTAGKPAGTDHPVGGCGGVAGSLHLVPIGSRTRQVRDARSRED